MDVFGATLLDLQKEVSGDAKSFAASCATENVQQGKLEVEVLCRDWLENGMI